MHSFGCGMETTYYRDENGNTQSYEIYLPNVIRYRRTLHPQGKRERYIEGDAFKTE